VILTKLSRTPDHSRQTPFVEHCVSNALSRADVAEVRQTTIRQLGALFRIIGSWRERCPAELPTQKPDRARQVKAAAPDPIRQDQDESLPEFAIGMEFPSCRANGRLGCRTAITY
jgi:hypothetical protein